MGQLGLHRGSRMKWNIYLPLLLAALATRTARSQEAGYHEDYQPSPYHYEYKVHDPKEYLDFGAAEEGDGKGDVHGQYHVQLPDGRLQHVSYHVDDYNGYIADVSYDGHAEHPSYHGGHHGVSQDVSHGGHHGVSHGGHHGVSHGGVGGGHRFGKALVQDSGVSPQVVTKSKLESKPFTSFGNNPNRHENSFFSDRQVQQRPVAAPVLPPSNIVKETSSRHGKSGRQDFDENSTNLFGSSSHSKPTVHASPVAGNTLTKSTKTFESKFGEPKTNSFFDSVEKSQERPRNFDSSHDRPRDFDSFSPIFGTGSSNKGASKKPEKSFDTFSPIFGKQSQSKEFSGRVKTINKKPVTGDTDFFKPM